MVVPSRKASWLSLLFAFNGTIFVKIRFRVLFVVVLASLVTWAFLHQHIPEIGLKVGHVSLVALALSIFLGFRNNTSYDRFWEGRKLWGGIVNTSRTFCRQVFSLISCSGSDRGFQTRLVRMTASYPHLLRMHLRDQWTPTEVEHLLDASWIEKLSHEQNRPIALLHWIGMELKEATEKGWLPVYHQGILEETLKDFSNLQGGCERIKATPIPFSYNVLLHRIVAIYCLTLPFGLVTEIGWLTPIVVGAISYAFLGLDAIGDEIENPFEGSINDLPLQAITHMIESNLRQRLGESPLVLHKPDPTTRILN